MATNEITITKEEYDRKTRKATLLTLLCFELAHEWVEGARNGYGEISDTVKSLLKAIDPNEAKIAEIAAANARKERLGIKPPVAPNATQHKDNPLRVDVGDRPDLEPKITCDSTNN